VTDREPYREKERGRERERERERNMWGWKRRGKAASTLEREKI